MSQYYSFSKYFRCWSLRFRHDWATSLSLFIFMHWRRKWKPTPVTLPGESKGQGSLVEVAKSWTRLKRFSSSSSNNIYYNCCEKSQYKCVCLWLIHVDVWQKPMQYCKQVSSSGFSCGRVWMWELDCEEGWVAKNWCFWTVVLVKTLESPLDCKEIQPVHSEGDQPWDFFGRNDAKAETPVL